MKKIIFVLVWFFPIVASAQTEATFSFQFNNQPLPKVLTTIESACNVRFSYNDAFVSKKVITLNTNEITLLELLDEISLIAQVNFTFIDKRYIFITNFEDKQDIERLDVVVLNSYLTSGIFKKSNGNFTITPSKLELLPGLTGPDVLESIQQLPGVVSPNETASGMIVRGGNLDQNHIIWDGVSIYHKGHLFGMISPFNSNAIKNVDFYSKGTHPRFGDRVSSVVDIESNSNIAEKLKGSIEINGISANVFLDTPVFQEKLSVQGSFRRSYNELYQSFTYKKLADKVFQESHIVDSRSTMNDFSFLDYNFKINYRPNKKNRFSVSTIFIENNLDHLIEDASLRTTFNDKLSIKNDGYSASWKANWNDKIKQNTQVFLSKYKFKYQFLTRENNRDVSDFSKQNEVFDSGVSSEVVFKIKEKQDVLVGYRYNLKDVGYVFLNTEDLSFILDEDKSVVRTHSVYGNYKFQGLKGLYASLGARINYFKEFKKGTFEPRVLLSQRILKNLTLQASGEIKNQIVTEIEETVLSDFSLEDKLWRLVNNDDFPLITSRQISLGALYTNKGWSLDMDYYYKTIAGMATLSLGFLNPLDSYYHIGKKKVRGIDFYLKKDFKPFRVWLSYSFQNIKIKYKGLNDDKYFTSSVNLKHTFTASLAYKLKQFQMGLSWNWRSGKPYTKALVNSNDGSLYFDEINTETLPSYHRLDASTTYDFSFSKTHKLRAKIGVSVRNLYNKKNHLSKEYSGNNSLNDPVMVVDKFSLALIPNLLMKVYW